MSIYRQIPSVDKIISDQNLSPFLEEYGHALLVETIRDVLQEVRKTIEADKETPDYDLILNKIKNKLLQGTIPSLKPVINASGVLLHTNLGRAPLSSDALSAIQSVASAYSNLEYDLGKGSRGKRDVHAADLLCQLTGAEAALVVNNNAGAVMLILAALANRKKVAISRSQLVEIGGGFRIPEVMRLSGAKLLEIGTTNRTHLEDYRSAIKEGASLILLAHQSNFKIIGFTSAPDLTEITQLARENNIPTVFDLGSGALLAMEDFGLKHEMTVQEALQAGVDVVSFSGDKLLGGPQAGLIVGKAELIARIRKHPFYRALRADKLCLAALNATLLAYLKGKACQQIPILSMLSNTADELKAKAEAWQKQLGTGSVVPSLSTIGGGSLPEQEVATWCLALKPGSLSRFSRRLRQADPAIIGKIENNQLLFDPRTVLPEQEGVLLEQLKQALSEE
jgi:L-seryl-tRNA(Ser) seleniumtransferase